MKVLLFVAVLMGIAWSYTMTISCGQCSQSSFQLCTTFDGGPFDNYEAPAGTSCQGASTIFLQFTCSSSCPNSCLIQGSNQGQTQTQCLDSTAGSFIVQALNFVYGQSQGNPSAQYEWCQCNGSTANVGLIVGLVVGGVVLVAIIGGVIFYIRRKKQMQAQSGANGISTLSTGRTVEMG